MDKVEDFGNHRYLVKMKERAEDGRANLELLRILSKYLGTPTSRIQFVTGLHSRDKILEVE